MLSKFIGDLPTLTGPLMSERSLVRLSGVERARSRLPDNAVGLWRVTYGLAAV